MPLFKIIFLLFIITCTNFARAADLSLRYQFAFVPDHQSVDVHVEIPSPVWLRRAEFDIEGYDISQIEHNGKIERSQNTLQWRPPRGNAFLKYRVKVNHERAPGAYDAYIGPRWALLRGEDLIPPVRIKKTSGAEVSVIMNFKLPKGWSSVNTGWERLQGNEFAIVNTDYTFARPAGWIVAGDLGTRHEQLQGTQISVSAPREHNFRQMELLAFITLIWPHLAEAVDIQAPKVLVTGAAEPMWRGGLSGPNSLYIHSGRPLVSENGTSTIIHELFHVVGDIHAESGSDWIVEGLAEFYSVEALYRAGGFTKARRQQIFDGLRDWSKDVKTLRARHSKGVVTARAAVLFDELNKQIMTESDNAYCLDHLVRQVQRRQNLNGEVLAAEYKKLIGKESRVLQTPLLKAGG